MKASKRSRNSNQDAVFSGRFRVFLPVLPFTDAPLLWAQQSVAHVVEIGQAEEHFHLRQVLREAPVTHLRMPPQALHYQIRMLTNGPHSGETPVARFLRCSKRMMFGAAHVALNSTSLASACACSSLG